MIYLIDDMNFDSWDRIQICEIRSGKIYTQHLSRHKKLLLIASTISKYHINYVYIPAQQELNQQRHAFLDWKLTEGLWHHIVEQGESAHSQPGIDKTWFLLLKYSELMMFQTYPSI